MDTVNIYALISPISNDVFYVGATKSKLEHRITGHMVSNYLPTIQEIKRISKRPLFIILEKVHKDIASETEKKWIEHFRSNGASLENSINRGGYAYTKPASPGIAEIRKAGKINIVHSEYSPSEAKAEKTVLHLGPVVKNTNYKAIELF